MAPRISVGMMEREKVINVFLIAGQVVHVNIDK